MCCSAHIKELLSEPLIFAEKTAAPPIDVCISPKI